ncbi:uncharacterized protein MELLADRAFT_105338 [Melampsora larici-populina 98AG31]|uniref:Uncharacterized protein n=1 Tax=Melampsora larici-populina (strain 98AG31 / pathotype 3-4-7) TaxID=747676 RepID=F4RHT1_MELLP|nr:uncharacterized protein MELLADRAFT_105338 [Melampsora larici-populina 98AG31]EGG07882.1 hypothetical protein MELLADRAFT_105338 [Melampsora larici-populina 98AG31]
MTCSRLHGSLTSWKETSLGSKESRSRDFNMWTSPGIMDGVFPSQPISAIGSDPPEGQQGAPTFSYYLNWGFPSNKKEVHEALQNIQESLQPQKDIHRESTSLLAVIDQPLIGQIDHLQPSEIPRHRKETEVPTFKGIVQFKPPEKDQPTHSEQYQPTSLASVSSSFKKDNGALEVTDQDVKDEAMEQKLICINADHMINKSFNFPKISTKDSSNRMNKISKARIGDPEGLLKVAEEPENVNNNVIDINTNPDAHDKSSYNGRKTNAKSGDNDKKLISEKGKFKEEITHGKSFNNKNPFKALEDLNESLESNLVKGDIKSGHKKQEFQKTTDKLSPGEEAAEINHKNVDPSKDMDGKVGQKGSKTVNNKKGKKNTKSKQGRNKVVDKDTTIASIYAKFLDSSSPPPSTTNAGLTREELFKLNIKEFLMYCLKFHDKTLHLPILLGDLEFEYLISSDYLKSADRWGPAKAEFATRFGHFREATRRIKSIQTQFQEKRVVWNWNLTKDRLPKYAQAFVQLLRPDEEFPSFRDSDLNLWNIFRDRENALEKRSPTTIEKVAGIFGGEYNKRIVTLSLMSRYYSSFLDAVIDSGAVKEGIDLPVLIVFDHCLRLQHETGLQDDADMDDIQFKAAELIEAMNGDVLGYGGTEYCNSSFEWVMEYTRFYLTKEGSKIAKLVKERIANLAYHADRLGVKIPDDLKKTYDLKSFKGLTLGEILLSTFAALDLDILVKLKNLLNLNQVPGATTRTKTLKNKQTGIIGEWGSIKDELSLNAFSIKRYCDLRGEIISGLEAYVRNKDLDRLL